MSPAARRRAIAGASAGTVAITALALAAVWGYATCGERRVALERLAEARRAEARLTGLISVGKALEDPWERLRLLAVEVPDIDTGRWRVEQAIRDAAERAGVEILELEAEVAAQPPPGDAGVVVAARLRFVGTSAQAVNCSYLLERSRTPAFWFDRVRWSATGDRRRIEVALKLRVLVLPVAEVAG